MKLKKIILSISFILILCGSSYAAVGFSDNFEGYVLTHVKKEMSPNWPIEALKAQAILARTFELNAGHGNLTAFADFSQTTRPVLAVKETSGLVLKYQGRPAAVFYHADSGGMTSTPEAVWGAKQYPYLVSKPDCFTSKGPDLLWQKTVSKTEFEDACVAKGLSVGRLICFKNIVRDSSGRISKIDIIGTNGSFTVNGNKFRNIAGIKSTLVNFGNEAPKYETKTLPAGPSTYTPPKRIKTIDRSTMPENKQEKLVWFAENGIFSVEEFMNMLVKTDKIDEYIALGMQRLDSAKNVTQSIQNNVKTETKTEVMTVSNYPTEYQIGDAISFTGRGWGHGVGLPQWQAKVMAENGWSYRQILEYYFPGLTLEQY